MKIPRSLVWMLVLTASAAALFALEPPNLTPAKQAVVLYADSGEYLRDLAVVSGYANDWITARAALKRPDEKLALVLDIDETALTNLEHMKEMDFGYIPHLWDEWVAHHHAPAIEPVLAVYRQARRLGVAVFFITGRREKDRPGTESNLVASGYGGYEQLLLKPDAFKETTQLFKIASREKIQRDGWTIIANMGDQQSDLDGGAAERTYKLPNPFYLIK
ncbi:MAG: HAD family acid phosphatase [Opitutaceae bacterium]|nr:HAD family acid phosphatase [Opitutaceae bacterium]